MLPALSVLARVASVAKQPGFFARIAGASANLFRPTTNKAAAIGMGLGLSSSSMVPANTMGGGFFGLGGYAPHEPFTQAWQRNMEGKNFRDPSMLAFSGVYACVAVISQDIAKMPFRVMEIDQGDNVTERVAKNNPYHRLLRNPNDYQTAMEFMQFWQVCKLLRGNAYGLMEFDNRGVPVKLHILHPDRVKPLIAPESREVYYEYTPRDNELVSLRRFSDQESTVVIPSRFIIHDRINCLWHPLIGTSPLYAGAMSAATGGRIMMNSERLFGNMARPSGVLTSAGTIEDVTAVRLKREFEANYSEGNIGRTAVLGDGLKWEPMVMTSVDSQLIEQLKWTIEDVARVYRVPMYLLNDTTRMTYKNAEQASQAYFSGCLQYHVEATEARFSKDFDLVEGQQYAGFDVQVLFRMDMEERFTAYSKAIQTGILSPNEARAMEGRGPMKGGEEPRMQMQYVPLSTPIADPNAAQTPSPAATPEPAEPTPPGDDGEPADDVTGDNSAEDAAAEKAAHAEAMQFIARMAGVRGRLEQKLKQGILE